MQYCVSKENNPHTSKFLSQAIQKKKKEYSTWFSAIQSIFVALFPQQLRFSLRSVQIEQIKFEIKLKMEKWQGKVAVITGGNSGIGLAILKKLAQSGIKTIGFDIEIDNIMKLKDELKNVQIYEKVCDVTKDESVESAFEWAEKTHGGVDILINTARTYRNVGVLDYGKPVRELQYNIDVDFVGAIRCARLGYKSMETRDTYGYIINVNANFSNLLTPMKDIELGVYSGACSALQTTSNVRRKNYLITKIINFLHS
jgi:NADP+-dependent farnesol dehydrogenase